VDLGVYPAGKLNAITDVPGVRVGHTTLIRGDGKLVPGQGPVRTGVTVVIPREDVWHKKVPAGAFVLNGTGEMTGLAWARWLSQGTEVGSPGKAVRSTGRTWSYGWDS